MDYSFEVKRVNKNYDSCNSCGCSTNHCICLKIKKGTIKDKVVILTHGREISRSTNTGRIIKQSLAKSCEIILWERKSNDSYFTELLEEFKNRTFLIYPSGEDSQPIEHISNETSKTPRLFIVLDGTWSEVKKIKNRSNYLNLPTLTISKNFISNYPFRRTLAKEGMSTIESVIHLLKYTSPNSSEILEDNYQTFIEFYNRSKYSQN